MRRHGVVLFTLEDTLELRLMTPCDADEIYQVVAANRDHLSTFLPWVEKTKSVDDTRAFIQMSLKDLAELKSLQYAILYEGRIVGLIGAMIRYPETKTYHIGYWIDKAWTGRGFVTRSAKLLIGVCFEALGATKVEIICATHNEASNKIPQRLGLRLEGTIRNGIALDAGPADLNIYGLLASEHTDI